VSPTRRLCSAGRLTALAALVLLAADAAGAQGFFPRGDADCSADVVAADLPLGLRAIGGSSVCDNDDCDRDGEVTAADIDCAVHCLFGDCPVVVDGPMPTEVTPLTTPDIRPMAVLRVTGTDLGGEDVITQATIAGQAALVVELDEPNTLGIVVPTDIPPGPADLVLLRGDVPGPPIQITIAPPAPVGDLDTYDATLALMDDLSARVLALDLDAELGENATLVRDALDDIRAAVAEHRSAVASDPDLTPPRRAALDTAIDASGLADLLRQVIDEIETAEAQSESMPSGETAGTAINYAKKGAVGLALAAGILAVASLSTAGAVVAVLATATGIVISFASGPTTMPVITKTTLPTAFEVGGTIILDVANIDPARTTLVLRKPSRPSNLRVPLSTAGNRLTFSLPGPEDATFCGRVDLILEETGSRRRSRPLPFFVVPHLEQGPDQTFIGRELDINLRGGLGCLQETFAVFENASTRARTLIDLYRASPVAALVPDIALGFYNLRVSHGGFQSESEATTLLGISGVSLSCGRTSLFVPPQTPSRTQCTLRVVPGGARFPRSGSVAWVSSDADIGFFGPAGRRTEEREFLAFRPGSAMGTATLSCGRTHACDGSGSLSGSVTFTVVDELAPNLMLTTDPAGGEVRAGSAIQVTATAVDNVGLQFIRLTASGEAVETGSQSFTCDEREQVCEASFTVNLKRSGFTNNAVSLAATATDSSDNSETADPIAFTVTGTADMAPPVIEVLAPAEGAIIDAGATAQVSIRVTDNAPDDTGVKQTLIRVEGSAVASGPDPERLCLPVPMMETTRNASFTIKDAAALAQVSDRNVLIVLQAADAAGAACEDGNLSPVQFVRVRAGNPPVITSVPSEVNAGEQLTITGQHFGAAQGSSVVTVGGMTVSVVSWSDTSIIVAIPMTASGQNLPVIVSVAALDSNAATTSVLGTGDVQITLTWRDSNDLDLHVVDPSGEEISYTNDMSESGGILDVDANAGCGSTSASPRENVFWPPGTAPTGPYTVRVVYYSGCTEPNTPSQFDVMLRLNGGAPMLLLSGTVGPGNAVASKGFTR